MRRRAVAWVGMAVAVLIAVAGPPAAQAIGRQQIRAEFNLVVNQIQSYGIPGGVIGVTGGRVGTYQRAFGVAQPGQAMQLSDHFRIGSVSKTFTATVILELVDQNKLSLDTPIAKWEPNIPNAKRITIRMLLGMRSGIWDEEGLGPEGQPSKLSQWIGENCKPKNPTPQCGMYWRPQQLIDYAIQEAQPAYPPGRTYYYSDTNYMILGLIAHEVTGRPMGVLMKRMIFDRLQLTQTSFPTHQSQLPAPATAGYIPFPDQSPTSYIPGPVPSPSMFFGAGNIVSTLHDLRIWARALGTGALLRPRTQRERVHLFPSGFGLLALPGYGITTALFGGYGLGIATAGGMLGHNGELSVPGYTADLWYAPRVRGTIVVLLNSNSLCNVSTLADSTAGTLATLGFGHQVLQTALNGFPAVTCPTL
jgi:D-alanyl-D-alanine carboxypeptidase